MKQEISVVCGLIISIVYIVYLSIGMAVSNLSEKSNWISATNIVMDLARYLVDTRYLAIYPSEYW